MLFFSLTFYIFPQLSVFSCDTMSMENCAELMASLVNGVYKNAFIQITNVGFV